MVQRHWYAVHTHPLREVFAAEQLQRQGLTVFFPRQIKTVRHARKTSTRLVGYFPGYLFVSLNLSADRWRAVNGTLGVRQLVMAGDHPARAADALIQALSLQCDHDGVMRRQFSVGETVRLLNGPLAETLGVIDRLDDEDRVRVLIDMIGGLTPVRVRSSELALAS